MALKIVGSPVKRGRPKGVKIINVDGKELARPPAPTYDRAEDKALYDEQQVARCENLMMKGVRDKNKLMALLDVHSSAQMEGFMRRVEARWELGGSVKNLHMQRGEQIAKLNMIENELWIQLQAVEAAQDGVNEKGESIRIPIDVKAFTMLLREIRETNRDRADMVGLTKEVIEQMVMSEGDQSVEFRFRSETYDQTRKLASLMMSLVERKMKVIDHERAD